MNVEVFYSAAGTPYENGIFRMKLILSRDFPHSPPKGLCLYVSYGVHTDLSANAGYYAYFLGLEGSVIENLTLLFEP